MCPQALLPPVPALPWLAAVPLPSIAEEPCAVEPAMSFLLQEKHPSGRAEVRVPAGRCSSAYSRSTAHASDVAVLGERQQVPNRAAGFDLSSWRCLVGFEYLGGVILQRVDLARG